MMSQDRVKALTDHIRENAPQYFTDLEKLEFDVKLREKQERPASTLYQFSIGDVEKNRTIFVKVPHSHKLSADPIDEVSIYKPRLFARTETSDMYKLEYTALSTIYNHFTSLGEKQLGTIRVLDYLPEYQAIVVEATGDPNLRQLFLEKSRLRIPHKSPDLHPVFQNTGRWLRAYHGISKEDNVKIRHAHRYEYTEAIVKLTDYMATVLGDKPFFQRTTSFLDGSAYRFLPESLPMGLGHGDFAMRNILVGAGARITVIDTFAKWRTPIYEDIGYFLHGLRMSAPQVFSQGLAFGPDQLLGYENSFLGGYFGQKQIPYPAIRLFEILALLDKWSSILMHYHRRSAKLKFLGGAKTLLVSRYFRKGIESLLQQIDGAEVENRSATLEGGFHG